MSKIVSIEDPADLTRYIESWYHARHREQLSWLIDFAERVERVHGTHPDAPIGLSETLRRVIGEIEAHMRKEEAILFPALRDGRGEKIAEPIALMRRDHARHTADIEDIRRLTGGPSLPQDACRTWVTLYQGIEEFIADLEEHIRLEDEVLFPQFETSRA